MLNIILGILMTFGPVLGYIDQIMKFRATKSSFGFSLDTPGILLISSIIRVFFWIGKRFDIVLLYQSIVMIIVQIWLLYECIRYRIPTLSIHNRKRWFWNWRSFRPYMACLIVLLGHLIFFSNFFGDQVWFIELLGYLALGIECTLPMPQAIQNYKNKSVSGFRYSPNLLS
ncbi:PQ-loop protein [Gigaspora margarita]|uniref:PQ-loop protein n=1 Tax=Gigaspora margarita TaxID=4874 RepID=A0A8H3X3H6_GIGMA|nr:PQ-loop protein [Gigaspora margarita]